jgi:hypothetical protein
MWKEVSEARYDEALGVLSPTKWLGKGFLMGEPHDHRLCTVTNKIRQTYASFIQAFGRYYEGEPAWKAIETDQRHLRTADPWWHEFRPEGDDRQKRKARRPLDN